MAHAIAPNHILDAANGGVSPTFFVDRSTPQFETITKVLQAIPAGVVLLDENGRVQVANQMALDLLGEPLEQELWRNIIDRAFKPRKDDGLEISLVDGRRIKLSVSHIPDYPGQLIHLTDLTETRALQSKVSHMQKLYSLGKMVASLAHQIRTPLSAAMLYAANLSSPSLSSSALQRFSGKLMERLKDLESQVNDMLLFARSDSQQVVEPIKVQKLLADTYSACKESVKDKHAHIENLFNLGEIEILGNQTALQGALLNLVHNAVDIGGKGTQIQLLATDSEDEICLTVTDNGPGINVGHFSQLFEPFYTTRPQGTGLGLAVVHSVARAHQGRVFARNNLSSGASFQIILPKYVGQKNTTNLSKLSRSETSQEAMQMVGRC